MEIKSGLTLIELLVTIALVSILSVAGFSSFKGARQRGRDSKRKSDLNQVKTALRMYYNDNQVYPNGLSGVISDCNWGEEFSSAGTIYMKQLPEDFFSSQPYYYECQPGGEGFDLYACLENSGDKNGIACHINMTCDSTVCFKVSQE